MLNKAIILAAGLSSFAALAQNNPVAEDLTLPGAKWVGKPTGYICGANATSKISTPAALEAANVVFGSVVTDSTLDNALLKATFTDGDSTCSYSAIILADNAKKTVSLVESRAFASEGEGSCEAGKALLDNAFASTQYLYWGHPHHVTVLVEDENAAALCGEGATHVGVDFTVAGRL